MAQSSAKLEYRPFWVANMIWVRGDRQAVQALAQRDDVEHLYANPEVNWMPRCLRSPPTPRRWRMKHHRAKHPENPCPRSLGRGLHRAGRRHRRAGHRLRLESPGPERQIPRLGRRNRRPQLQLARRHPQRRQSVRPGFARALRRRRPRHAHHGHHGGRGVDTQGDQFGMAPGASWIGCRNMNQGFGTPATYSECYQWFIAPTDLNGQNPRPDLAPDVINNSWGCPASRAVRMSMCC